jgi:hypothetical protein
VEVELEVIVLQMLLMVHQVVEEAQNQVLRLGQEQLIQLQLVLVEQEILEQLELMVLIHQFQEQE